MKKPFAHSVTIPATGIPSAASEAVAAVQDLRELDTAEARDGEKRCRLHFDHDAAFVLSTRHPRTCLTIYRVSGPGLAADVVVIVLAQHCLDRLERSPRGRDLARRR